MAKKMVPLPKKKITYKKGKGDTRYVYYTLRAYRNEKGQPTSDEISIGKLDNATGMLIPNMNYYGLFPEYAPEKTVRSVGYISSFMEIAQKLSLANLLVDAMGQERAKTALSLASYMLSQGNVMMDYPSWMQDNYHDDLIPLSSQAISEFFASITEEERIRFFKKWTNRNETDGYIAYDVTSISSYSNDMNLVEWGYNRDDDNLAQINLGMYYGEDVGLPLFYKIYPGSIVDKSYFESVLAYSRHFGLKKLRIVMDQGLLSPKNFKMVCDVGYKALSLLSKNYKLYKELIEETVKKPFSSREFIGSVDIYSRSYEANYEGIPVKVHMYYNSEKATLNEKALYADIKRKKEALELIVKQKTLKPSQTKYFKIHQKGQTDISYEMDYDAIDEFKSKLGYFALISTDMSLSAEEALTIYREKDVVEKAFDQLKNGMDYRRMRTHYAQTTEGKTFVVFISLIVRSVMIKKLKGNEETSDLTIKQAIKQLENILELHSEGKRNLLTISKMQRNILAAIGVEQFKK